MEWPNYVYRDFNLPNNYYGEIEIVILPENKLHIQVNSLHQNYTLDYLIDCPAGQADIVVKYHHNNLDLFTVITTILDKLTDDHRYYLGNNCKFSDFIYCYPEFVKDNPDLPYIQCNDIYGWALLEFTLENMKYVGVKTSDYASRNGSNAGISVSYSEGRRRSPEEYDADEELITLYGDVNQDGMFTYDYPVISREMSKKYYDITRRHNVRRIKLEPDSLEYIIDPNF